MCVVSCVLVLANIGEVHTALRGKLYRCFHEKNSLQGSLRQQRLCLECLYRCLTFLKPLRSTYIEIHMGINQLCGGLNTGERFQPNTWKITSPGKLGLYLVIHRFQLPSLEQERYMHKSVCRIASVHVKMKGINHIFCGHRVPWNMSSLSSYTEIKLHTTDQTQRGCYFTISFEVFDMKSLSTGNVQQNFQIAQQNPEFIDGKTMESIIMENINSAYMIRHLNPSSLFRTEIQLYVFTDVFKQIVVKYSNKLTSVQIHDGPGPLSPIVRALLNSSYTRTAVLTSFQAFITYRTSSQCILDACHNKIPMLNDSELSWSSVYIKLDKSYKQCMQYPNALTLFSTTSGYCQTQKVHSRMIIHQLLFTGFDTLFQLNRYTESDTCHYGGLFMVFHPRTKSDLNRKLPKYYLRLCSNVTEDSNFPHISHADGGTIFIVFQTFKGYSSGFIDMTIHVENDCYGRNVLYQNKIDVFGDNVLEFIDNLNTLHQNQRMTHCLDLWLLHNIMNWGSGRAIYTNCTFDLPDSYYKLADLVGSVRLTISGSILYPSVSYIDPNDLAHFTMTINAETMKDYPVNDTIIKSHTFVNLFNQAKYSFNLINKMSFRVRHGEKYAPIFAVRIQFLADLLCGSLLHNNFSDYYPVYKLNSDFSNVFVSKYYPSNTVVHILLNKTGHIHGPCRMVVEGQNCSHTGYQVQKIHFQSFYAFTKTIITHKVDVSLMTEGCSANCSMGIEIWEIFDVELKGKRVYSHKWNKIYRLTWYAVANWGYSLFINSSCANSLQNSSCMELCDVAVSMHVLHQHNLQINQNFPNGYLPMIDSKTYSEELADCLKYPNSMCRILDLIIFVDNLGVFLTDSTKREFSLSEIKYGNWYEAQEFCMGRNSHLLTLTPTLPENVTEIFLAKLLVENKVYKSNIFDGLHRSDMVSTNLFPHHTYISRMHACKHPTSNPTPLTSPNT